METAATADAALRRATKAVVMAGVSRSIEALLAEEKLGGREPPAADSRNVVQLLPRGAS
jgi:hypothetical protein